MFEKLDSFKEEFEKLNKELEVCNPSENLEVYQDLIKRRASLEPVVEVFDVYKQNAASLASNKELISNESDKELITMAKEENTSLEAEQVQLEAKLKLLLLPKDPNDDKNIIMEIRPAAGGDEAALFAEELLRSYSLYAQDKGWKVESLTYSKGNAGGCKEAIVSISGDKVYSILKYEGGVHRVQRVPATESQGRVHTSTVTVVVLPEAAKAQVNIDPNDLRIDVYRSSGCGGQSVNTTDSAVRVTHVPTGLVVSCQDGKSQLMNKEQALKILYSRLLSAEEEKKRKVASDSRMSMIGTGDRSERIRTYNFPQQRLTDHRIGLTVHNLDQIMQGDLEDVSRSLIAHYQAEQLKQGSSS